MADLKSVLEAVNTALSTIKAAADLPGVNMLPYVSTVSGAIGAIQIAYNAGLNIAGDVEALRETFSDGLPSEAKRAALDARIAALRARIHAPMPAREADEPE